MTQQITIRVGFGEHLRDLIVHIPDDDIPPYQPGDDLRVVGHSEPRVDAVAKVTGRARYTYDQSPPGLLYGRILRCPHPNAEVRGVDVSAALALPGVKAALTFPEAFGQRAVRFAWDGLAAVAAETEQQAEDALRAIRVDLVPLPFCVTREDSMRPDAPRVGRGEQANVGRTYPPVPRQREGSVDAERAREVEARMQAEEAEVTRLLAACEAVVGGQFTTPVQTHSSLETHGVVCHWEGDRLNCHISTQGTFGVLREMTSPRGAVQAASARIRSEFMGGGFGSKFSAGREGVVGALLARQAGRPVKLMLDRREEHTSTGNRPDSLQQLTLGVMQDGSIRCLRVRGWGTPGTGLEGAGAHNDAIYELGTIDKVEYGVRTNCGDARAMRAPGWPQGMFALESVLDMAAAAIGMDPIEFRKKNDRHPIRTQAGYDLAARRAHWAERRNVTPGAGVGPVKRGLGVAVNQWYAAGGGGASVLVRVHRNGTVEVRNGAQDIGTGTRTILGQVAAEELGLRLDQVQIALGDTEDPRGPTSGGSVTAPTIMPAARLAAHRAKRALLVVAAERLGVDAEALDLKDGHVVRKDGTALDRALPFAEVCAWLDEDAIEVLADRPTVDRRRPNYEGYCDTNSGVQIAEVEVDTGTGEVRVTRVVAVQDCGKILNPRLAESQVIGGVIQGVSYALFERRIMDRQEGRMLNADLEGYKVLGPLDCPEIDVALIDVYNGRNNTGVMGLGEPPIVSTAAAVANAVANAIGVRIHDLPITPRRVLEALAHARASAAPDTTPAPTAPGEEGR